MVAVLFTFFTACFAARPPFGIYFCFRAPYAFELLGFESLRSPSHSFLFTRLRENCPLKEKAWENSFHEGKALGFLAPNRFFLRVSLPKVPLSCLRSLLRALAALKGWEVKDLGGNRGELRISNCLLYTSPSPRD